MIIISCCLNPNLDLHSIAVHILQSIIIDKARSSRMYIPVKLSMNSFPYLFYFFNLFFCRIFSIINTFNCFFVRSDMFLTHNLSCISCIFIHKTDYCFFNYFYLLNTVFSICFNTNFKDFVLVTKIFFLILCIFIIFSDIFIAFT